MSTPITLSGFNNIDFGSIVTALINQARQPEIALQKRQFNFKAQVANLSDLSTKLGALDSAASDLAGPTSLSGRSVSTTDSSALTFTPGNDTPVGTYDIVVNELARAQVTASSTAADANTTNVATGGSLTIGGVAVNLTGNTTLQGLANAINATEGIGVAASVVQSGTNAYKLVLTGKNTGAANSFAIVNGLTGSTLTFGANSVTAIDASITVNNVTATSSTNTFSSAIAGATITVQKKDAAETVTATISEDTSAGKELVSAFVSAYNDLVAYVQNQQNAANQGDEGSLGHDSALRTVSTALRQALGGANTADSTLQYLANVGIGFSRTGQLTFNESTFDSTASTNGLSHVQALFSGAGSTPGVFGTVHTTVSLFNGADGLVQTEQRTLNAAVTDLSNQIAAFEARLKIQQQALQEQFYAADQAISRLNGQQSSLSNLGGGYRLF